MNMKADLTAEFVRSHLRYDRETGQFFLRKNGRPAGHLDRHGYGRIAINGAFYFLHRLAWLYEYGEWPTLMIDHINRTPRDNRIANLRQVTPRENTVNSGGRRGRTSRYKGVGFHKQTGKWQAMVSRAGKATYLGLFSTEEAAKAAYDAAAIAVHGEIARLVETAP
jgi:hypothetical protein